MKLAALIAIAALGACLPRAVERPLAKEPSPVSTIPAGNGDHAPSRTPLLGVVEEQRGPRVLLEEVEGANPQQVRHAFANVERHLRDCSAHGGALAGSA